MMAIQSKTDSQNFMSDKILRFVRIINSLCSCGRELGKLQPEFEFRALQDLGDFVGDDIYISKLLDEFGIMKICCRKTILGSPVYHVVSADVGVFKFHREKGDIEENIEELLHDELLI